MAAWQRSSRALLGSEQTRPPFAPGAALVSAQAHGIELAPESNTSEATWWDGLLKAVPKKKVSHSRKAMRSANKGLKDRTDFVHCPACGTPKLAHHICKSCYSDIAREQKAAKRAEAAAQPEVR
ncbi:hypothetical protein IE81DRAFT_320391 [Ceraceosorus guamensis]|uniref:Large ribosomal subunit protein bL32m n=1 Tax=Ceraceosorus guamensis TaxID=1522189 RepID=A0A316W5H8_9BASI|nr:hypothetical protein IE81DRAFT_320391 [Ceraceosorus guamensis]PWN45210.1 hypothetical protein IE81DRAFT_320391 [Ceraceosorus guamensis]